MLDEEGNVVAGETIKVAEKGKGDEYLGPLGQWIMSGTNTDDILQALMVKENHKVEASTEEKLPESLATKISVHTIPLPSEAPKKMLLDLKRVLETFPGKEKVQLQIGKQIVPLPVTINMSTVLQKKVEEVLEQYETAMQ